jgi:hypothetical protein
MTPSHLAATLRQIAAKIDNSKSPRRDLVAHELHHILAAMDEAPDLISDAYDEIKKALGGAVGSTKGTIDAPTEEKPLRQISTHGYLEKEATPDEGTLAKINQIIKSFEPGIEFKFITDKGFWIIEFRLAKTKGWWNGRRTPR